MATALIVGGTGGIGNALVHRFTANGDDVVFTYLRAEDSAKALCDAVAHNPGSATARQLDVRDIDRLVEIGDDVSALELRSVLFTAASGVSRRLLETRKRHWSWVFEVNVRPLVPLLQHTVDALAEQEGTFFAFTSLGSRVVFPRYSLVGAAKAAIEATVRYAAAEVGPRGVRVNAICPGVIETKALRAFPGYAEQFAGIIDRTPLGRLVRCDEVADIAFWLASPPARMITGQVIVVDGGWEIVGPLQENAAAGTMGAVE